MHSKKFLFSNANWKQGAIFSADIPIARPEHYERASIPDTQMQRTCSWINTDHERCLGQEGRCFTCSIIFPIGIKFSELVLCDYISRGGATPVSALFLQEDVSNLINQTLVPDARYFEVFSRKLYEMQTRPKHDLFDGTRYRFRIDILYQSHHYADAIEGFVGITRFNSSKYSYEARSFLPAYSAWKKIFPNMHEYGPEGSMPALTQVPWISAEMVPLPPSSIAEKFKRLPNLLPLVSANGITQTSNSPAMDREAQMTQPLPLGATTKSIMAEGVDQSSSLLTSARMMAATPSTSPTMSTSSKLAVQRPAKTRVFSNIELHGHLNETILDKSASSLFPTITSTSSASHKHVEAHKAPFQTWSNSSTAKFIRTVSQSSSRSYQHQRVTVNSVMSAAT